MFVLVKKLIGYVGAIGSLLVMFYCIYLKFVAASNWLANHEQADLFAWICSSLYFFLALGLAIGFRALLDSCKQHGGDTHAHPQ